jgi:hypothetical protein
MRESARRLSDDTRPDMDAERQIFGEGPGQAAA